MKVDITAIVLALIPVVGMIARAVLITKLTPQRLATTMDLARTAVQAAEKVGDAAGLKGPDKYAYAENALIMSAKRVGLKLKPAEANSFIHAVLAELDAFMELGKQEEETVGN